VHILADENVPGPVVAALRSAGHDVLWVKESMSGAADLDVLARAVREARLVVTFDKDFGELAVRTGLPASSGVVLLRLRGNTPEVDNARAIAALTSRDDWAGHFAVVTDDRVRLRPLPRSVVL
jgi:predicted nuclease of predicted toxin-antitoxin system